MGFIYALRNSENTRVYIGQTRRDCKTRFYEHKKYAHRLARESKLYTAMNEIGTDSFYIEVLEECSDDLLDTLENFYINKYNSVKCGYNTYYPVSTYRNYVVHDYTDKVIDMYKSGFSFAKIAKGSNISANEVAKIVRKYGIERDKSVEQKHTFEPKPIVMYSLNFEPQKQFSSIKSAYKWLLENSEYNVTKFGAYAYIDVACSNGNVAYGHRWQTLDSLRYNGILFRSKFDLEDYLDGAPIYLSKCGICYETATAMNRVKTMKNKQR